MSDNFPDNDDTVGFVEGPGGTMRLGRIHAPALVAAGGNEQIGAYFVTHFVQPHDPAPAWYFIKTASPLGEGHSPEIMAHATSLARARHVAAALACLDVVSRMAAQSSIAGLGAAVRESWGELRACLAFADRGEG